MKLLLVAGARPNYMKIAPLVRELRRHGRGMEWRLVDTGQHYDYELSKVFFAEFEISEPDHFLGAGSGSHAFQTARIMVEFEKVCQKEKPDLAIVVGDVNSTLACSITAKKMGIKVAHVEAGLRSFDRSMPEEINRILTDRIADFLFVSEPSGLVNLRREGFRIPKGKSKKEKGKSKSDFPAPLVAFVGNIMIDTLFYSLKKLESLNKKKSSTRQPVNPNSHKGRQTISTPFETGKPVPPKSAEGFACEVSGRFDLPSTRQTSLLIQKYAVLTLHRPANVDEKEKLQDILSAIAEIAREMPVFFPCHPRTRKSMAAFKLEGWIEKTNIRLLPSLPYLEFLALWKNAALVLTDSGGIQEETTVLGIPCFTIRDNTERPITVSEGTNVLAGTSGAGILKAYREFKKGKLKKGAVPELWDGQTARRIVDILINSF